MAPCPVGGRKSMTTNPSPPPRQRTAVLGAAVERSRRARERLGASSRSRRRDEQPLSRLHIGKLRAALCLRGLCLALAYAVPVAAAPEKALGQALERPQLSIELVDPKIFRVCADPHNMPFSTDMGEGFENRLAELFAPQLGKSVSYTWYPQAPGFVRNTLRAYKCDVVMGMPQGDDVVQVTNPYYRTDYARQASSAVTVVPLVKETGGPRLAYRIAMGVRHTDQEWKRLLNRKIAENQDAINKLLLSFGVPLLDEEDRPLSTDSMTK